MFDFLVGPVCLHNVAVPSGCPVIATVPEIAAVPLRFSLAACVQALW
jgi:hypothetical protein